MRHYGITQSQHCNHDDNYSNDNVICMSLWFEFFGGYFNVKTFDIWEGNATPRGNI